MDPPIYYRKVVSSEDPNAERFVLMRGPYNDPEHETIVFRRVTSAEQTEVETDANSTLRKLCLDHGHAGAVIDPNTFELGYLIQENAQILSTKPSAKTT